MLRIVYTNEQGGTSVVCFPASYPDADRTQIIADITARGLVYFEKQHTDIPTDRYFRNAWTLVAGTVVVDMVKARLIHRNKMRAARVPLFAALDIDYLRADEAASATLKLAAVAKKQLLRDAPQDSRIDTALTPADLKAIWPICLGPSPP